MGKQDAKQAVFIPQGSWPPRLHEQAAAGYCGEKTVRAFLNRVGKEYPQPVIRERGRKIWLRKELDQAMNLQAETQLDTEMDAAEAL